MGAVDLHGSALKRRGQSQPGPLPQLEHINPAEQSKRGWQGSPGSACLLPAGQQLPIEIFLQNGQAPDTSAPGARFSLPPPAARNALLVFSQLRPISSYANPIHKFKQISSCSSVFH